MSHWITSILVAAGAIFMLLGALGIARMPDLFSRMQTSTKSSTLGIGCIMLAAAWHFQDLATITRASLVIAFFFLTAPVAAHMIARAAYFVGVPLWKGTRMDELRGHYDRQRRNSTLDRESIHVTLDGSE